MGKEKKIGLAVILILLISLGVVVVKRFSGSTGEPEPSALEQKTNDNDKAKEDSARKEAAAAPHARRAAVVAPKVPSSQSPKSSLADLSQLSVVSDRDDARSSAGSGGRSASPPSYMPRPPHERAADPYDRYGSAASPPSAPRAWPDERAAASDPVDSRSSPDPFHNRTVHNPSRNTEEGNPSQQASRSADAYIPAPPRPEPARPYGPSDYRSAAGSRYESGSAASAYGSSHGGSQYVPARSGSRLGNASTGPSWGGREFRREDGTYEIQPNDSYWIISEKVYGTGAYFKALAEHNRKKVPQEDCLPVGEVIAAPDTAQLEKAYPDLCPKPSHREDKRRATTVSTSSHYATGRTYVVQEGDTLFDIARTELGKASRWAEIYELNRDQLGSDYNYLPRGLQLLMPGSEAGGSVTHRPGTNPLYRR